MAKKERAGGGGEGRGGGDSQTMHLFRSRTFDNYVAYTPPRLLTRKSASSGGLGWKGGVDDGDGGGSNEGSGEVATEFARCSLRRGRSITDLQYSRCSLLHGCSLAAVNCTCACVRARAGVCVRSRVFASSLEGGMPPTGNGNVLLPWEDERRW